MNLSQSQVSSSTSANPVYASIFRRAVATLIDLFALAAFLWFFGVLAASRYGGWMPDGNYTLEPFAWMRAIGRGAAAWLVYFACLEWWLGASLGKLVAGARVTSLSGKPPNLLQALVRNALRLIDGIVFYAIGAVFVLRTKKRQRLGDLIARTIVRVAPASGGLRAAALVAVMALPAVAYGVTWSSGLMRAASNRWMSSVATTRLHGEANYETHLEGGIDLGSGKSTVRRVSTGYASGESINDTLILDGVGFSAGADGAERSSRVFRPGDTIAVRFALTGIVPAKASTSGRIRTVARILDGRGASLFASGPGEDDVAAGSKRTVPRRVQATLPASCLPGGYIFQILVDDLVANRHVKADIPFTVAR